MNIFISHITEEASLAIVLKEWLESTFAGHAEVFVSSDLRDIPAGAKWLEEIDRALDDSAVMLLLCSPASISRPWVNFEAGCGWIKRIPILPICHSTQRKDALPAPISSFLALELDDADFTSDLINSLARHLSVLKVPRIDHAAMLAELKAALGALAGLHAKPAPSVPQTDFLELEDTAIKILEFIAKLGDAGYSASQLAVGLRVTVPKMDYFLDSLVDQKLIHQHLSLGGTRYTLTKAGRKFLVAQGLL